MGDINSGLMSKRKIINSKELGFSKVIFVIGYEAPITVNNIQSI